VQKRSATVVLVLALLALAVIAAYVSTERRSEDATADADGATPPATGAGRAARPLAGEDDVDDAPRRAAGRAAAVENARALARGFHAAVQDARQRSQNTTPTGNAAPTPNNAPPADDDARGTLDPQYIRDAVQELRPLIAECYDRALEEQSDLEGSLVVEFTLEGEPGVGGVVEGTRIADTSTLTHPSLDECVRETMYTLRLPAPGGSGSVHVRYPFRFSPRDESDGGAATSGDAQDASAR
jgi:hypothetical protein